MANQLEAEADQLRHEAECVEIGQFIKAGGELRRGNMDCKFYIAMTIAGHEGCDRDPVLALREAMLDEARAARAKAPAIDEGAEGTGLDEPF